MRLEQLAAANAAPTHRISLRIAPQSGYSLTTTISFAPETQRRKLIVAPRSKPVSERDMGAGDKQWSALNVAVERKKNRCAECTRPLPEGSTTSACQRCQQTSLASASPPNADISTSGGGGDKVRLSIAVLPTGVAGNRVNLDIACLTSSAPRKAKKKEGGTSATGGGYGLVLLRQAAPLLLPSARRRNLVRRAQSMRPSKRQRTCRGVRTWRALSWPHSRKHLIGQCAWRHISGSTQRKLGSSRELEKVAIQSEDSPKCLCCQLFIQPHCITLSLFVTFVSPSFSLFAVHLLSLQLLVGQLDDTLLFRRAWLWRPCAKKAWRVVSTKKQIEATSVCMPVCGGGMHTVAV